MVSYLKHVRGIFFALSIAMSLELVTPAYATTIDSVKKEQKETQGQLNAVTEQINNIEANKQEVSAELDNLQVQMVDILTSIGICAEEITIKEKEIKIAQKDLEEAQALEDKQYADMKKRIQFLYEKGDASYLQVLLQSSGFTDMVNKADYVEKLYNYDRKLLTDYVASKEAVEQLKEQLVDQEADLEASKQELLVEQQALDWLIAEKKETVENFEQQLAVAKKEAERAKKKLQEQNAMIRKLEEEAERKRKEAAEAERKRREEARKKRKEERRQAQEAANADGTEVDVSEEDLDDDYDDIDDNPLDGLTAGAATVDETAGTTSSAGQGVVNYASQFVGNPYVFGGTSLTNGTDCSGFTQAVYSHFGISIPRDSFSQRSCGVEVPYEQAQPGDIVCYAGHVALYAGNGQIVHASTERTGITWGYATYRTILSVRRIL